MSLESQAICVLDQWYSALKRYQNNLPARGAITAALHVLNRLRAEFNLDIDSHVTGGKAQIVGLSSTSLRKLLADFGETRRLSSEAGRSNRGGRGDVVALLAAVESLKLDAAPASVRGKVLRSMQSHIVTAYVSLYFSLRRVKATFDRNGATWQFIQAILDNARQSGKAGAVAEYLVGAKLALRFPRKPIRNKRFSTSDIQSGFSGDFEIGNTVFHVTVAPMPELFEKCKTNLERGLRVYLIVPDAHVSGARQNAQLMGVGTIAIEPIESFVATNVDEVSEFDGEQLKSDFRRLLETYNTRVDAVELDKSLLIDIPPNLK